MSIDRKGTSNSVRFSGDRDKAQTCKKESSTEKVSEMHSALVKSAGSPLGRVNITMLEGKSFNLLLYPTQNLGYTEKVHSLRQQVTGN